MRILFLSFIILAFISCNNKKNVTDNNDSSPTVNQPSVSVPEFNADSAYQFVKDQIAFGPRVPNTKAHIACGDYLEKKMEALCDTVTVQKGIVTAYDGTPLKFR